MYYHHSLMMCNPVLYDICIIHNYDTFLNDEVHVLVVVDEGELPALAVRAVGVAQRRRAVRVAEEEEAGRRLDLGPDHIVAVRAAARRVDDRD